MFILGSLGAPNSVFNLTRECTVQWVPASGCFIHPRSSLAQLSFSCLLNFLLLKEREERQTSDVLWTNPEICTIQTTKDRGTFFDFAALYSQANLDLRHRFTCTKPAKPCYVMPKAFIWLLCISFLTLAIWKLPRRNVFSTFSKQICVFGVMVMILYNLRGYRI